MKKLLALVIVALMAGAAFAQPGMGVFFSNSSFGDNDTNFDAGFSPFNAYIVLLDAPVGSVGAYECSLIFSDVNVFVLSATGANGWTNFGSPTNHIAGFQTPLPVAGDNTAVLCTVQLLYTAGLAVDISMGGSTPSSFSPAGPGIANGANPDDLIACFLTSGNPLGGVVATLNSGGVTATEAHSLTEVKALFD
ncbi:MAG: hypothetical protein R3D98_02760 [Candidatus Krumholzibacteriia bacterium]